MSVRFSLSYEGERGLPDCFHRESLAGVGDRDWDVFGEEERALVLIGQSDGVEATRLEVVAIHVEFGVVGYGWGSDALHELRRPTGLRAGSLNGRGGE